jgi:hypothetical protein
MLCNLRNGLNQLLKILCFSSVLLFTQNNVTAQCFYSPVIAKEYFTGDCGEQYSQNLLSVQIPVYGNHNGLHFTSPLTNDMNFTATQDFTLALELYPNPTFGLINIKWGHAEDADVFIYSQLGQLISKSNIFAYSSSTIDVQNLLPGYYVIKAITTNNQTFISKLIKQ